MNYQISRNGQIYGPYTLDDLKRYLAAGNVLLTDLVKSEEMPDWVSVQQLLSQQGAGAGASYAVGGAPYSAAAISPYPDAPNLHWALVMLFTILTCGVFMVVWNLIVSAWLRRVQPNANAFYIYIVHAVLVVLLLMTPGGPAHHHAFTPGIHFLHSGFFGGVLAILIWVSKLIARFSEHASLEEHFNGPEPMGLVLNPVMTFFFGGLYFQYHLTRLNAIKQAARFGQPAPFTY